MTRMPVPPLQWRNPDCPICGHEVANSDVNVFECRTCKVLWDALGNGEHQDPEIRQCYAEKQPFIGKGPGIEGNVYRCVCDLGHKGVWHVGIRIDGEKPDPTNDYLWMRDS